MTVLPARSEVWWCEMADIGRRPVVNLDWAESVSVAVLVERQGRVPDVRMRELGAAAALAVDCAS